MSRWCNIEDRKEGIDIRIKTNEKQRIKEAQYLWPYSLYEVLSFSFMMPAPAHFICFCINGRSCSQHCSSMGHSVSHCCVSASSRLIFTNGTHRGSRVAFADDKLKHSALSLKLHRWSFSVVSQSDGECCEEGSFASLGQFITFHLFIQFRRQQL